MKKSLSAWSVLVLSLTMIALLAGCGGVSANTPRPTPTPTPNPSPLPNPTPTPAAHGTFVYFSTSASNTVGYRLNSDGTLVALSGSPFAVSGGLAAAGSFLAASSLNAVSTFQVDPATGALSPAGSGSVNTGGAIAADAHNVYVTGNIPANTSTGIYGFALSGTGALTPLSGSPYTFTGACDLCDVPDSLTLNNNVLVQGGTGFHTVGDFTTYARGAGGVLGPAQILGTSEIGPVAIQHPTGSISYGLDQAVVSLDEFTIGSGGKATPGPQTFVNNPSDILIDNTNKFLLMLDFSGVVHVFTIDQASGALSQIGTSEAAGNGAFSFAMDTTGRFVIVSNDANPNFSGSVNQITVYTFDPGTGAMKKLQAYPQSASPNRPVVITR
jgi:lactonase family protein with 7-bladed beta-propeller